MRFEFKDDSQKICNSVDVVNYGIQCDICGNKVLSVSNINGKRYCAGCYYKTFMKDNQKAEVDQLKQQLAEKQKTIDEINKEFVQAVHDWKALCAEKDKEISRLKERLSVIDNFKDNYGYTNYDDREILEDLQSRAFQAEDDTQVVDELLQFFNIFDENELVDKVKEPQTQLAIQELEKVKDFICDYSEITGQVWNHTLRFLNNRIKELKGE